MNPANQNISELLNLQRGYLELRLPTLLFAGLWIGSSMVEQLTLNQLVEGSSPSRSTKFLSLFGGMAFFKACPVPDGDISGI